MIGDGTGARASRAGAAAARPRDEVRQQLRRATSAWHARLERRLPPEAITRSRSDYTAVLAALYGFYAPLESRLRSLPLPIDGAGRAKLPALRADLSALGKRPADIDALPICERVPSLPRVAEGLGSAYVIEGATLGGRIIARAARARLGVTADAGGQFFACYGTHTGERWREFVAAIESAIADEERGRAARAARRTFVSLARWLGERGVLV